MCLNKISSQSILSLTFIILITAEVTFGGGLKDSGLILIKSSTEKKPELKQIIFHIF